MPETTLSSLSNNGSPMHFNMEQVRKRYESMSLDEMTQSMAENNKQLSEALGNRFSMPPSPTDTSAVNTAYHGDYTDERIVDCTDIDITTKRATMNKLLSSAVSAGDVARVKQLLEDDKTAAFIDINAKDEDGGTPLIYAACFNKVDVVQVLLDHGANTDLQDSMGWSALMWATANNHEELVKVLLDHGASALTKSSKGRTVFDFVKADNQKMGEILAVNHRDSISSISSLAGRFAPSISSASSVAGENDFYYQASVEGFDKFMMQDADRRQKLMETAMAIAGDKAFDQEGGFDDTDMFDESSEFVWDKCLPDQMFVFGVDDLPRILDTVICDISLPVPSPSDVGVPANVVFLSARFAHHFCTPDMLDRVLGGAIERITWVTKENAHTVQVLAFWITNLTQLVYYLRKDTSFGVSTASYQRRLSELVSEIYAMLVNETERRLVKLMKPAMLEYEPISGLDEVSFVDEWKRFFRRKSRRSETSSPASSITSRLRRRISTPGRSHSISPYAVTALLTWVFRVLQEYSVHPTIIIQTLAQLFHFISCELFNHILATRKLLSRSKALQVRMNLSYVEDWIRHNRLPLVLISYLSPLIQLLQLLQCLSQLDDLTSFVGTTQKFDLLNALQIKRCIVNYRYEVGEPRVPQDIESYAVQIAAETVRYRQARSLERKASVAAVRMIRAASTLLSRRDSMPSLVESIESYSTSNSPCVSLASTVPSTPVSEYPPTTFFCDLSDQDQDLSETKDPKFMLPFSVPASARMVGIKGWASDDTRERFDIPVIPDAWMEKLDQTHHSNPQAT